MAKIKAAQRNKMPDSDFGLPSQRKYLVNDRTHAATSKARATQMVKKGTISASQKQQIDARANRVLQRGKRGK